MYASLSSIIELRRTGRDSLENCLLVDVHVLSGLKNSCVTVQLGYKTHSGLTVGCQQTAHTHSLVVSYSKVQAGKLSSAHSAPLTDKYSPIQGLPLPVPRRPIP